MKKIYYALLLIGSLQLTAQKLPFQGRLLENSNPFTGNATFTFSIASPAWSETLENVTVQDGYYSVVLGNATALPDTLFKQSSEVQLTITVQGEQLSPVTLYAPLKSNFSEGPVGIDSLQSRKIAILGAENDEKVDIRTSNNGYDGVITLRDSLNRGGNFFQARPTGGYLQIAQQDFTDDGFKSAVLASAFGDQNSYVDVYGGNSTNDGIQLLADLYASNIDPNGPIPSGYRRGGLDLFNYYGSPTHNIFSFEEDGIAKSAISLKTSATGSQQKETVWIFTGDSLKDARMDIRGAGLSLGSLNISQDSGGENPEGSNANLELFGDESVNIQLGSNSFQDHDLAVMNLYGSIADGGSWWFNTAQINSNRNIDGSEHGTLSLFSNTGGQSTVTANLTGNLNETGSAGLELSDITGGNRIRLDASSGNISVNRQSDSQSAINLFDNGTGGGGIAIQNTANSNMLFYEAGTGSLDLKDPTGIIRIKADGTNGDFSISGVSGQTRVNLTDDLNGTLGGGIEILDNAGSAGIILRGEGGNIAAGSANFNDLVGIEGNIPNDEFLNLRGGGISGGTNPFSNGFNLNYDASGGALLEMFSGDVLNIFLNGNNGDISTNGLISSSFGFDLFGNLNPFSVANISAGVDGTNEFGNLALKNTSSGTENQTALITGNLNGSGGGGLELLSSVGSLNILIEGESGNITAVSVNQTSDRRLKRDIKPLEEPLKKVSKLRGVNYYWKDSEKSTTSQIGVIAQEVEKIYPEFVHTDKEGMKAVNYAQMTAVLIEAIKELNKKVERLESENTNLKASLEEVSTLRKDVDQLMRLLGTQKAASK